MEKFNWKRLLITILIVLFSSVTVGGTTWYVMDAQSKKDKTETDKQIAALEKQVSELKTPTTATTTTNQTATSSDKTTNWKTYNNTVFNFNAKYPSDYFFTEATPVEIRAAGDLFFVTFFNNEYKTKPDSTSPIKLEIIKNSGMELRDWIAFYYKGTGSSILQKKANDYSGYSFDYYPDDSGKKMTGFATLKNGNYYSITASAKTEYFDNFLLKLNIN